MRVGGDHRDERRVDAAGQADHDVAEAVLHDVVARAEHERLVQLGDRVERRRQRIGDGLGALADGGGRDLDRRQRCLRLATARVEQALAVDRGDRHVDDEQVLDELGTAGEQRAVGVEGERAAVEHQLVLAADLVDVHQRGVRVGGPGGEHPLAVRRLAEVVGRGVDVDGELGAAGGLFGERPVGAPDVLADADAHLDATDEVELHRVGLVPRREVASLVEDGVVGQEALAVGADHPATAADRRRVEQVVVGVDVADDGGAAPGVLGQLGEGGFGVGDEPWFEHQVLGRDSR